MRNILWIMGLFSVMLVVLTGCYTPIKTVNRDRPEPDKPSERTFIDFSGFTGVSPLVSHQPSAATEGPFSLANGISGDGLRISNDGEGGMVAIAQYGGGMAAKSGGNYLYFFIDKPSVKSAAVVTLQVTFFDDSSGFIRIHYVTGSSLGSRYFPASIPKSGSNTFVTVRLQLDNCDFNIASQNQGAQFRFDSGAIIQRIEITGGVMSTTIDPPPFAPSTDLNNMIGKGIAGYQAWFNTTNWAHWGNSGFPLPGNVHVEMWPAGWEDYLALGTTLHDTGFTMPDGSTARLYNSKDAAVIRTHFKWMRDAGIDGAAVQRFYSDIQPISDTGNAPNHLTYIRDAAEETGRIFYIMYDMSHGGSNQHNVVQNTQIDWIYNVERKGVASSPNYAQADGKPVVCIWGVHAIETAENGRYPKVADTIALIQWFRDRGYYVIGGIPDSTFWTRSDTGMYKLFDMISPWYVGRDVEGLILSNNQNISYLYQGMQFCRDNPRNWADNKPIDFMPVIWPGFGWTNMSRNFGTPNFVPRETGQFAWYQFRNYLSRDTNNEIKSLYLAMFDEYDEATAWMKAGSDYFDIPLVQYFKTLAVDGVWLSSDYYLRLARGMIQAFKENRGNIPPLNEYGNPNSIIVEHSLGPVFWRNSFERREGRIKYGAASSPTATPAYHLPLDVGVPNGAVSGTPLNVTVNGAFTVNRPAVAGNATSDTYTPPSTTLGMVYTDNARSGESVFRLMGERTAGANALYRYKIADTRIKVEAGMRLSYWINAAGLGANVMVDLLLDNGTYVSDSLAAQNTGSPQGSWQQRTLSLPTALNGRYITAVIVGYRDSGAATGNFNAFIDDIIINR